MNASALLTSQGWLGPGHALDSRLTDYGAPTYKQKGHRGLAYNPSDNTYDPSGVSTGNGLIKPLLVSQRHGARHGIGKRPAAHEPASGNEWWLKGFQSALANIGKSESERSSGTSTPVGNGASADRSRSGYVGKHSGLYGYFVAGQVMEGTLEGYEEVEDEANRGKKRKSDVLEKDEEDKELATKDMLAVSPVKRAQTVKELEQSVGYLTERDKERRKAHERLQSTDVERFTAMAHLLDCVGDGDERATKTKRKQKSKHPTSLVGKEEIDSSSREETKEEKLARRRARKELKEKQRENGKENPFLAQMVEEELAKLSSMTNSEKSGSEDAAAKAVRRAERKKKREEKESARQELNWR